MAIVEFPDPERADEHGIVAVGGDLEPASLRLAYRHGIFPWPVEGLPLLWFSPAERGVLEFAELHVSRSLVRERRRGRFRLSIDAAFPQVIRACARVPRRGQRGTWITRQILRAYVRLHELGVAHSVEAWDGERLAGGVYGVDVDGAFAAESMFHLEPNASKLALWHLVEHLASRGLDWLDVQVLSPHLERLGAKEIPRAAFLATLARTRARGLVLFPGTGR
jgi:leucyl/phenylalanyl-tRNA--protein transferase